MKLKTLEDVYVEQLQDMHSAEAQLVKALPKMAKAATNQSLSKAFSDHLEQTKGHLEIVGGLLEDLGKKPGRQKCKAMEGLIEEGKELLEEDAEDDARDAAMIVIAQKVEHYEIAGYGSLRAFAQLLGHDGHIKCIEKVLGQEKKADELLTELAMSVVNEEAIS